MPSLRIVSDNAASTTVTGAERDAHVWCAGWSCRFCVVYHLHVCMSSYTRSSVLIMTFLSDNSICEDGVILMLTFYRGIRHTTTVTIQRNKCRRQQVMGRYDMCVRMVRRYYLCRRGVCFTTDCTTDIWFMRSVSYPSSPLSPPFAFDSDYNSNEWIIDMSDVHVGGIALMQA